MENKTSKKIKEINEGLSAASGIVSLAVPAFAVVPLILYGVNRTIGFISDDDIIKRVKKVEQQLNNKKITVEQFKVKVSKLSEHKRYFSSSALENIIKNCMPETVDIYISLFIDYVMNEKYDFEEELCEVISSLNKHDIELCKMIKNYLTEGLRLNYTKEKNKIRYQDEEYKKRIEENKQIEFDNNNLESGKIKKLAFPPVKERSIVIDNNTTIFWSDFSQYVKIPIQMPLNFLMMESIQRFIFENEQQQFIFIGKSFLKLEKLGILQLDFKNTLGTINSLDIDRFHITILGRKLLKYI